MKISSKVVSGSYCENSFPHKLLILTNTQILWLRKAFANNSSANKKLPKTKLHKIGQLGGFLGRLLGPLLKSGLHQHQQQMQLFITKFLNLLLVL